MLTGGEEACETIVDGYYIVGAVCVVIGLVVMRTVVIPRTRAMEALPQSAWMIRR